MMLRAGQLDVDDRVGRRAAGVLGERPCTSCGGQRVLVAVDNKKCRRAALGVVEWRRGQQPAARDRAVVAVEPYDRRNGGVRLLEPRLESRIVRGEARKRGQAGAK